jgi:hypothetical protein
VGYHNERNRRRFRGALVTAVILLILISVAPINIWAKLAVHVLV